MKDRLNSRQYVLESLKNRLKRARKNVQITFLLKKKIKSYISNIYLPGCYEVRILGCNFAGVCKKM
jgi:hypothetical protein